MELPPHHRFPHAPGYWCAWTNPEPELYLVTDKLPEGAEAIPGREEEISKARLFLRNPQSGQWSDALKAEARWWFVVPLIKPSTNVAWPKM